jgi:hypothetical protein
VAETKKIRVQIGGILTIQLRKQITYRLLCKTPTKMEDFNQFSSVLNDIDDKRETIQM